MSSIKLQMGRMLTKDIFLLITMGFASSCVRNIPQHINDTHQVEIQQALFKFLFDRYGVSSTNPIEYYCLSINAKDPPEDFIRRFGNRLPTIVKASECKIQTSLLDGQKQDEQFSFKKITHKSTDKRAVIFDIGQIVWNDDKRVSCSASYMAGELAGMRGTFLLRKVGEAQSDWLVYDYKTDVVW